MDKIYLYKVVTNKDPEAFGRIYDKYVDRIYRFIFFKVDTPEEAEDITSEVFLKSWQYLIGPNSYEIQNLSAFLYKLARNTVIDSYRKKKQSISFEELGDVMKDQNMDIAKFTDINMDFEYLWKVLEELKEDYKEAIVLRHIECLGIGEIAKILDKTNGSTRVLVHRAIATLRKKLKENQKQLPL